LSKPSAGYITLAEGLAAEHIATKIIPGGGANDATVYPVLFSVATGVHKVMTNAIVRTAWATQRRRSLINKGDVGPF